MAKRAPSRIERVSEVIKGIELREGEKLDLGMIARALLEAGCLDGVVVHDQAEARRYIRGLIRQHNRRCHRMGDIDHVIFNITEVGGKPVKVTEV